MCVMAARHESISRIPGQAPPQAMRLAALIFRDLNRPAIHVSHICRA